MGDYLELIEANVPAAVFEDVEYDEGGVRCLYRLIRQGCIVVKRDQHHQHAERLRDFAAIARADGRTDMARQLAVIADDIGGSS